MTKHPMILAVGEEKFEKSLQELPEYYTSKDADNYKPIGMWAIWYLDGLATDMSKSRKQISEAYNLWVNGMKAQDSVKKAMGIK